MPKRDLAKRLAFAAAYAELGNATQAARAAGVPAGSAHSMGYKWLRDPAIVEQVREAMNDRLKALGPVAIDVIRDILLSTQVSPQTRLAAARDILDRLGWIPPKRVEAQETVPHFAEEMSLAELEAVVSGLPGVRLDDASLRELATLDQCDNEDPLWK